MPRCNEAVRKLSGDQIAPAGRLRRLWRACVLALEMWGEDCAYLLAQRSVRSPGQPAR